MNDAPINLGQLKAVAKPFYDRLIDLGLLPAGAYPWTATATDDANYAPANLGQLKNVFNIDVLALVAAASLDTDGDGIPDAWENAHGFDPNDPDNAGDDADGDGLTNTIRKISIDGVTLLFEGRARQCILPEGATPRFSTIDNREFVRIEFEGVDEEPVIFRNRFSHPISGSERTVPHLYIWKSLTSRPMGPATKHTRAEAASTPTRADQGEAPPPDNETSAPPSASGGKRWLWVAVGGAVILAVALRLRFADAVKDA